MASVGQATLQPPRDLVARPADKPHSYRITWKKPANAGAVSYYFRIHLRTKDDSNWKEINRTVDEDWAMGEFETDFVTDSLQPVTTYEFKVESYSNLRPSGPHATITVTTGESAPTSCPRNFRVAEIDTDRIEIEWDPPYEADIKGKLTGYVLDLDKRGNQHFATHKLSPGQTSFVYDFLTPGTVYRFQVAAINASGIGPFTDIIEEQTILQKKKTGVRRLSSRAQTLQAEEQQPPPPNRVYSIRGDVRPEPAPASTNQVSPPKAVWKPKPKPEVIPRPSFPEAPRTNPEAFGPAAAEKRATLERVHSSMLDKTLQTIEMRKTSLRLQNKEGADAATHLSKGVGVNIKSPTRYEELKYWQAQLKKDEMRLNGGIQKNDALRLLGASGENLVDSSGGVRGRKHSVRAQVGTFNARADVMTRSDLQEFLYENEKDSKIVIYISSLESVRRTRDACNAMLKMFDLLSLKIQVKDVHLEPRFARELRERTIKEDLDDRIDEEEQVNQKTARFQNLNNDLPQLFINAVHIGGLDQVQQLVDTGELKRITAGFQKRTNESCSSCGGSGYIICQWCQGSRKSLSHDFNSGPGKHNYFLHCTVCNSNGLQQCDKC